MKKLLAALLIFNFTFFTGLALAEDGSRTGPDQDRHLAKKKDHHGRTHAENSSQDESLLLESSVVYDSAELTINSRHLHWSSHAFELHQPANGYLMISKNTPKLDIRQGFLILNSRLISLTHFLRGENRVLQIQASLKRTNRLKVFMLGSADAAIRITVHADTGAPPPPEVTLTASPQNITAGMSSTLSWSAENATACVIEPDIGSVDINGTVVVTPDATTTYTITATGTGGTVTAQTTISVTAPTPTVTFSSDKTSISAGESATLTWRTANADTVSIDNGIGAVAASGSVVVSPTSATTYTITAEGSGGSVTGTVTITVVSPITIQILAPLEGESINRPNVLVRGTFADSTGNETGITVNGQTAMVYGNQFAVNHVPLATGQNTITVTATGINGHVRQESITVAADPLEYSIEIQPNIESSGAPLRADLSVHGSFALDAPTLTHSGPGTPSFTVSGENEYRIELAAEGIHYITAEAVYGAQVYADTIALVAWNTAEIDALLQRKWSDMKTRLAAGNIESVVEHFETKMQDLYRDVFTQLSDRLPQLVAEMQETSLISVSGNTAKYRIRRQETHNTGTFEITYYIYFTINENGLWKIYRF